MLNQSLRVSSVEFTNSMYCMSEFTKPAVLGFEHVAEAEVAPGDPGDPGGAAFVVLPIPADDVLGGDEDAVVVTGIDCEAAKGARRLPEKISLMREWFVACLSPCMIVSLPVLCDEGDFHHVSAKFSRSTSRLPCR